MADYRQGRNPIGAMSAEQRAAAIEKAEIQRIRIVELLEERMQDFARLSGKKSLGKRKYRIGKAPNDWKKKNKL